MMTHFGFDSSMEDEPWGLFCLLVGGEDLVSSGLSLIVLWEALAWEDTAWETLLSGCEIA